MRADRELLDTLFFIRFILLVFFLPLIAIICEGFSTQKYIY